MLTLAVLVALAVVVVVVVVSLAVVVLLAVVVSALKTLGLSDVEMSFLAAMAVLTAAGLY